MYPDTVWTETKAQIILFSLRPSRVQPVCYGVCVYVWPAKAGRKKLEEGIIQVELRQTEKLRETFREPVETRQWFHDITGDMQTHKVHPLYLVYLLGYRVHTCFYYGQDFTVLDIFRKLLDTWNVKKFFLLATGLMFVAMNRIQK